MTHILPFCFSFLVFVRLCLTNSFSFSEMDLFAFINQPDPFKVRTGERTLKPGEATLLKETVDRVLEPTENTVSLIHHTVAQEVGASQAEKKAGKKRVRITHPAAPKKKRLIPLSQKEEKEKKTNAGEGSGISPLLHYLFIHIFFNCIVVFVF